MTDTLGPDYEFEVIVTPGASGFSGYSGYSGSGIYIGTKPVASQQHRGKIWFTANTSGSKDNLEVCIKLANDTYSWVSLINF